ncbi:predicted protein [Pyrenophora tritici-repentis Pt-1C-BFP]|uniref:Uncharacterized protein n=1 Tax=Pyrenophora tritici-repentis (strain Pt-1C-BFP) TaxID=426418 RepID=B2W5Z9_PYRTR|nr:uncharacterized protein PTRG_06157 [Pyrenophora tritici-repentis Pt-1C-BFP]EDU49077.1 predicted protein [Pyrenophora tritici-repentis Pt-1C-BFP]
MPSLTTAFLVNRCVKEGIWDRLTHYNKDCKKARICITVLLGCCLKFVEEVVLRGYERTEDLVLDHTSEALLIRIVAYNRQYTTLEYSLTTTTEALATSGSTHRTISLPNRPALPTTVLCCAYAKKQRSCGWATHAPKHNENTKS